MHHIDTALYVTTKNRKFTTSHVLERLSVSGGNLFIFDDDSSDYDSTWLKQFTPNVCSVITNSKIAQTRLLHARRMQLKHFMDSNFDYCYFTDNDCFHHKDFIDVAKELNIKYNKPVGLFYAIKNAEKRKENKIFFNMNNGCSLFFSKNTTPFYGYITKKLFDTTLWKWDGPISRGYSGDFVIPEYQYMEHIDTDGVNSNSKNIALNLLPELKKEVESIFKDFYV